MTEKTAIKRSHKRNKRIVTEGIVHINASFNNTLITFTDRQGSVLTWATGGSSGFKNQRKGLPWAAQMAMERAGAVARDEFGMQSLVVHIKGPGPGRDAAVRSLANLGFKVLLISDKTGLPHNGCRPPKRRRV